jgi:hypothetical protein
MPTDPNRQVVLLDELVVERTNRSARPATLPGAVGIDARAVVMATPVTTTLETVPRG